MSAFSRFRKRNPKFTWFFIIVIIGLALMETANCIIGFFPDKGVGFVGSLIFSIILFVAIAVEDKLEL